jgi:hypothetical protein
LINKRLYIKSCFISLRCSSAIKKTADVILECIHTKFALKTVLCPHLTYIVPESSKGQMLKQTAGGKDFTVSLINVKKLKEFYA